MKTRSKVWIDGGRGVGLITITYVYFLIFAQFGFIKRLAELDLAGDHLKAVMAAMAFGGILLSLLTPRVRTYPSPQRRLQIAFALCAVAALLTLLPLALVPAIAVSSLIGAGLGLLTVTLVTNLRVWLGEGNALLKVGLGTGVGYLVCNLPPLFVASPQIQAALSAALCLMGFAMSSGTSAQQVDSAAISPRFPISFPRVLLCFAALVWLDSAAFFIIQNTPAMKAGTWEGSIHLWVNGLLHLLGALASAWLLIRRGLSFVLSTALLALACACLLLLDPHRAFIASVFYPIGVSLYSVALVAYPSLLAPSSSAEERGRQAGWIYAIAGWGGSAMGIGMGQNLGHVPLAFVLIASGVVLAPHLLSLWHSRHRELTLTAAVLVIAFSIYRATIAYGPPSPAASPIDRGRQVYIAEGCINCHSQYVRPHSADVLMWGPVQTLDELRQQHPPLIGNRRQGPDLSEVGNRRSTLWLKAHFYSPSELTHSSFMPAYTYLFEGSSRGDDLVAYLQSLKGAGSVEHFTSEHAWKPGATGSAVEGPRLFNAYCRTCHAVDGYTRRTWQSSFRRLPPDLIVGPYLHLPPSDTLAQRQVHLAQIIKFGLPGTDMPGHEYLRDEDVASLSLWLQQGCGQKNVEAFERRPEDASPGEGVGGRPSAVLPSIQ